MKTICFIACALFATSAFAKDNDFLCKGKDRTGKPLTVKWDGWKDNRGTGRVDLTIDTPSTGPRTTYDLYAYVGDEGFDYGVTSEHGSFMFHITLPPNMLGNGKIAGVYYYGGDFSIKNRVILTCKATTFRKAI